MKNSKLKQEILSELFTLDPSLQKQEAEISKLIDQLLFSKPNSEPNEDFKRELREIVLNKIQEKPTKNSLVGTWQLMPFSRKLLFSGVTLFLVVIASLLSFFSLYHPGDSKQELALNDLATDSFVKQNKEAFGALSTRGQNELRGTENSSIPEGTLQASGAGGLMASKEMGLAMPYLYGFDFEYIGKKVILDQKRRTVYRRIKKLEPASIEKLLKLNPKLIDPVSFEQLKLQSVNLIEDRPLGLSLNISFSEGSVSINKNWPKWQDDEVNCLSIDCTRPRKITKRDIPADKEILAAVGNFIQRHHMNLTNYEKPIIQKDWESPLAFRGESAFIPQEISVLFPLKVGGQNAYNSGGRQEGMVVRFDIKTKKVAGLHGLTTQRYESSSYLSTQNFDQVLDFIKKRNSNLPTPEPFLEQEVDSEEGLSELIKEDEFGIGQQASKRQLPVLQLETPDFALLQHWHTLEGETQSLLVPALVFPIKNAKDHDFYQENIVVPLIKELLK